MSYTLRLFYSFNLLTKFLFVKNNKLKESRELCPSDLCFQGPHISVKAKTPDYVIKSEIIKPEWINTYMNKRNISFLRDLGNLHQSW